MGKQSSEYFQEAKKLFPGGVNSPVRAFKAVGGQPLFIESGSGSRLRDVDGNTYIDYVLSWGPLVLGHAVDSVQSAVREAVNLGSSFGAPSPRELALGQELQRRLPFLEKMRFVNSGTEATMSAIRLARAVTGREKIIKFEGCYHGHSDSFLIGAGSGVASLGLADSAGLPAALIPETLVLPYNDSEAVKAIFQHHASEIAGVIVEAVAGNMGLIPADRAFLETIALLCEEHSSLFIVDEVMTGFRAAYGGACELYQLQPDLVCLGKVIGGGFPVAAFGGKACYMDQIAPLGPVYQAGTLSGNPIAMAAGLATLLGLGVNAFAEMEARTTRLCQGIQGLAKKYQLPVQVQWRGSMFSLFFADKPVQNFKDAQSANYEQFANFHQLLLTKGIYWAPSQYESNFLSLAHTDRDIEQTLQVIEEVFRKIGGRVWES
ncbi:glutamate-1-semialdehyde 2,1-aminomutase [Streptococcus danieliae]|uniref:Glutamate-1-semialdehyde 2,1-aminomutase n=1 Tax=Streptococcus danieliae TaxID=747656 RepID=A0A7X3G701_9STRE|nr:glutamate-1-semialdehyde 2,1-aminomutase [Streptococcus danieliae]MVX58082.1 glutamate-1-semialdehyde 2,1-aminomutase [Streptococcus danieliae]